MSTVFTSDPGRSIALLWGLRGPGRRGPKQKLDLADIVRAAVALADAEGLEALSMRRVADAVGVSPMSLYTYVPSKAELIDLMQHSVWGETGSPPPALTGWRPQLEFIAHQQWDSGQRHPWMLQAAGRRPPLGPNVVAKFEAAFRAVDGLGLTDLEMEMIIGLLADYVRGAARAAQDARQVEETSGMTDAQWLSAADGALKTVLDPGTYPVSARVGEACRIAYAAGFDPRVSFEFGLQCVLDGVAVFIASRRRPAEAAA